MAVGVAGARALTAAVTVAVTGDVAGSATVAITGAVVGAAATNAIPGGAMLVGLLASGTTDAATGLDGVTRAAAPTVMV